jgi:hypothetical protein
MFIMDFVCLGPSPRCCKGVWIILCTPSLLQSSHLLLQVGAPPAPYSAGFRKEMYHSKICHEVQFISETSPLTAWRAHRNDANKQNNIIMQLQPIIRALSQQPINFSSAGVQQIISFSANNCEVSNWFGGPRLNWYYVEPLMEGPEGPSDSLPRRQLGMHGTGRLFCLGRVTRVGLWREYVVIAVRYGLLPGRTS